MGLVVKDDGWRIPDRVWARMEPLLPLPPVAYPAELQVERVVSSSALVAFEGNRYSVPPSLAGQTATVLARLGEHDIEGRLGRRRAGRDAPALARRRRPDRAAGR